MLLLAKWDTKDPHRRLEFAIKDGEALKQMIRGREVARSFNFLTQAISGNSCVV